ncbi:MAG: YebC/PmpR family DNA-binding transcriptional regulator [Candidatus Magasanikbacteria bacterium CG10_big_fil_rev_8_21_14_0_10_40_10]|uniref:Probable transcriptional regulatory protein COU31_02880 n=1 Tax=Candidatus Magasanikbacteria bacterium CG10_big_fil_rev_8_21_14_0_10_40_10 TaxID=1974648 RepID=A0A2M6W3Y4_9BACT|nr:MAG: YebC/PmpR family DNA-binding transcriptional regulator [Candidatus Magasanikbacteria bacterium CG10_big_fil_rev_8_21_14_0_10_40_10]
MSGHSKWHNIQGRKGKQDAKRSASYSKFSKLISVAARSGGDPSSNFSLRLAIDRAKMAGVPRDNIERAIKSGTGELKGNQIEEQMYEGYGPGGVAVLIKTVTDNKNRTISEIKHILSKNGGSMGGNGSVQWMFNLWGTAMVDKSAIDNMDEFEMSLIDAGVQDIVPIGESELQIKTNVENLQSVLAKLKEMNREIKDSGLEWMPKDLVPISSEVENRLNNIFAELEDHDDVEDFYTNAG